MRPTCFEINLVFGNGEKSVIRYFLFTRRTRNRLSGNSFRFCFHFRAIVRDIFSRTAAQRSFRHFSTHRTQRLCFQLPVVDDSPPSGGLAELDPVLITSLVLVLWLLLDRTEKRQNKHSVYNRGYSIDYRGVHGLRNRRVHPFCDSVFRLVVDRVVRAFTVKKRPTERFDSRVVDCAKNRVFRLHDVFRIRGRVLPRNFQTFFFIQ